MDSVASAGDVVVRPSGDAVKERVSGSHVAVAGPAVVSENGLENGSSTSNQHTSHDTGDGDGAVPTDRNGPSETHAESITSAEHRDGSSTSNGVVGVLHDELGPVADDGGASDEVGRQKTETERVDVTVTVPSALPEATESTQEPDVPVPTSVDDASFAVDDTAVAMETTTSDEGVMAEKKDDGASKIDGHGFDVAKAEGDRSDKEMAVGDNAEEDVADAESIAPEEKGDDDESDDGEARDEDVEDDTDMDGGAGAVDEEEEEVDDDDEGDDPEATDMQTDHEAVDEVRTHH